MPNYPVKQKEPQAPSLDTIFYHLLAVDSFQESCPVEKLLGGERNQQKVHICKQNL